MGEESEKMSLKDRTLHQMQHMGIEATERPGNTFQQMPEDPTKLGPKALQRSFTAMVAWLSYANEALAKTEIELLEAEAELRKAQAVFRHTCKESLKWKIDDQMILRPEIRKLERRVQGLQAMKIGLETAAQNYDNKGKALSREQSRRAVEFDRTGRA